jgi:hypothetical protein
MLEIVDYAQLVLIYTGDANIPSEHAATSACRGRARSLRRYSLNTLQPQQVRSL